MAFWNETYKPNLTNYNYKYDIYTRNLVGRSFGRCLRNRLLSGCAVSRTIVDWNRLPEEEIWTFLVKTHVFRREG
jgi:hypothetical protein